MKKRCFEEAAANDPGEGRLFALLGSDEDLSTPEGRSAWREFVEHHHTPLYRLAYHLVGPLHAEELVQETFLFFFLSIREGKIVPANLASWLRTVVVRQGLRVLRKQRREKQTIQVLTHGPGHAPRAAVCCPPAKEAQAQLSELMRQLPGKLRTPTVLYFSGGMTQDQIARQLACSQRTVSTLISEALEQLRRGMSSAGFSAPAALLEEFLTAHLREAPAMPDAVSTLDFTALRRLQATGHKGRPPLSLHLGWWTACAVTLVGLAGIARYWGFNVEPKSYLPQDNARSASPQPAAEGQAGSPKSQTWIWTFEKGVPGEFLLQRGVRVRTDPTEKTSYLSFPGSDLLALVIRIPIPAGPVRLRIKGKGGYKDGKVGWLPRFSDLHSWAPSDSRIQHKTGIQPSRELEVVCYLMPGDQGYGRHAGPDLMDAKLVRSPGDRYVGISISNLDVRSIELTTCLQTWPEYLDRPGPSRPSATEAALFRRERIDWSGGEGPRP